jgi:GT2 family glycosyltransferase
MNGIAAPIVAVESAPMPDFLRPRRRVSVVMVVYMTGEALDESVACVLRDPLVDEFVIVDNGSESLDAARLRTLADRDARVKLLAGHGNIGFARGANLGARNATGDVLVFLNPDAFLQPGCIAELVREVEERPVPCIVGGRVLNADRTEQRGARRGDITLVAALLSPAGWRSACRRGAATRCTGKTRPRRTRWPRCRPSPAPASACAARTSTR